MRFELGFMLSQLIRGKVAKSLLPLILKELMEIVTKFLISGLT